MSAAAAVVDASVWVSSLTPGEVHHSASQQWFAAYLAASGRVVAPTLLLVEVAGAIGRQSGDRILGQQALNLVLRLPVLHLVTLHRQLGISAAQLAADLHLCGADAVSVAVGEYLDVPLITWDREQLTRAAGRIAVRTP